MAWNYIRTLKQPTLDDAAKGEAHWIKMEAIARKRYRTARTTRARQHQAARAEFCQLAAYVAKQENVA